MARQPSTRCDCYRRVFYDPEYQTAESAIEDHKTKGECPSAPKPKPKSKPKHERDNTLSKLDTY